MQHKLPQIDVPLETRATQTYTPGAHACGIFGALIDPVTAAKVEFVASGRERAALEAVGLANELIPSSYGGALAVDQLKVPNLPGEPNVEVVVR